MNDDLQRWIAAGECKEQVLRFMALFDARAYADMEACVVPGVEWQRPDQVLRGLEHMREVLQSTPADVRVRHVITNLRCTFADGGHALVDSYYTVYRHTGAVEGPAPLAGPASMGRYRDELVRTAAGWRIARKSTFVDFRR